ncbi:MAG: hypothetical protein E3J72_01035 [Planctomycetota bacterium]|nr:MAG: hypothetical protein E3J72_01035 [Planctomycetota bacterium]
MPPLDLHNFFLEFQDEDYVIIKFPSWFPDYSPGSDIDIFCKDAGSVARKILRLGNACVADGFEIEVTIQESESHTFIDFYSGEILNFRFDLYQKIPRYAKLRIKSTYFDSILKNRKPRGAGHARADYPLYVPDQSDDLVLRYIEYYEWRHRRPEKIRHLEYVRRAVSDNQVRQRFVERLNEFVSRIPRKELRKHTRLSAGLRKIVRRLKRAIKHSGLLPGFLIRSHLAGRAYGIFVTSIRKVLG